MEWFQAVEYCNNRGWQLANAVDKEANDAIVEAIKNQG